MADIIRLCNAGGMPLTDARYGQSGHRSRERPARLQFSAGRREAGDVWAASCVCWPVTGRRSACLRNRLVGFPSPSLLGLSVLAPCVFRTC